MILEIVEAATSTYHTIRYKATRQSVIEAIEGVNRTAGCMVTLATGPFGAGAVNCIALTQGSTAGAGMGLCWTGHLTLEQDEEVWAIFNNAVIGDVCDLTVKVVRR